MKRAAFYFLISQRHGYVCIHQREMLVSMMVSHPTFQPNLSDEQVDEYSTFEPSNFAFTRRATFKVRFIPFYDKYSVKGTIRKARSVRSSRRQAAEHLSRGRPGPLLLKPFN